MSRLIIENASYVVTVDATDTVLRDTTITIDDGTITAIETSDAAAHGSQDPSADVIDARGKLVMPGLVNLHTHLPMTLLRGLAEDVDLDGFLARVWAAEGAVMDPDTVELGATLGALESLLGGVHDPARHVLPPRGDPPRGRRRGQSSRHRAGVLRRAGAGRPHLGAAPGQPALLARRARRDRWPCGAGREPCRTPPTRARPRVSRRSSPCCASCSRPARPVSVTASSRPT
jgi:cytosine/adenosine deaminase-related metal-dependent hydrolase